MKPTTERPIAVAPADPASANVGQVLRAIISELCEVDPAQIGSDFTLTSGRLRSSLGRAALDAKIRRRLGVKLESLHLLRTVGELEVALAGKHPAPHAPGREVQMVRTAEDVQLAPASEAPRFSRPAPATVGLACGIDVESVSGLPEAKDYWEEPFYRMHFTAGEISYCISQPEPRIHFAARWCAKEALKKCLPDYMTWEMDRIEVVRHKSGSPYLEVLTDEGTRAPAVALSLTHSADWALAVVVSATETPRVIRADPSGAPGEGHFTIVLSWAALVCSLLALFFALTQR